jgi:hypothetical protein
MLTGLVATQASDMYALGRVVCYMTAHVEAGDSITETGKAPQDIFRQRIDRFLYDSSKSEFIRPLLLDSKLRSTADTYVWWRDGEKME